MTGETPTSDSTHLPIDQILEGDCLETLAALPAESVDLIFADPPYNLQLAQELWRPNHTLVDAVDDDWDQFSGFSAYDEFSRAWLKACRRVLKPTGALWVIGTYHNIYRIGATLQDLGFWILNDVLWIKTNPMPNFRGVRFTNAHETLLWAQKEHGAAYTFNYHAMKALNEGLQMRSDWVIPICSGKERLRENGVKLHPTQKPEALLYRILLSTTNPGDVVLDPFFGSGTTGAVAKRLHRHWIGIERSPEYVEIARCRIDAVDPAAADEPLYSTPNPRKLPRVPFGVLLEHNLLQPGQTLYFLGEAKFTAKILADGALEYNGQRLSIHAAARQIRQAPCNGWDLWYYEDPQSGQRVPIQTLRQLIRESFSIF